jgi:hypothetical protein
LICCLKTRISASSATRDRSRSITIPKISLHKSNIKQQHRPILDQPPAGWGLRQGQPPDPTTRLVRNRCRWRCPSRSRA